MPSTTVPPVCAGGVPVPHVGVTMVPIWVTELQVALASVSGEPQVPPLDPLEDPPDDDPDAPLDPDEPPELLDPEEEPPASDEEPELLPLDEAAPLDDVEASSLAPLSPVEVPELELELQANEAPAPSATSATHHPATGNALDIVMSFQARPFAERHEVFLVPGAPRLVEEFSSKSSHTHNGAHAFVPR